MSGTGTYEFAVHFLKTDKLLIHYVRPCPIDNYHIEQNVSIGIADLQDAILFLM